VEDLQRLVPQVLMQGVENPAPPQQVASR